MLVLSRKVGQRIQIGEDVVVILHSANKGRAQIAIEAPRGVGILREELVVASSARETQESDKQRRSA
jgi:carbon storage regulator